MTTTTDLITGAFTPASGPDAQGIPSGNQRQVVTYSVDSIGVTSFEWDPVVGMDSGSIGNTTTNSATGTTVFSSFRVFTVVAAVLALLGGSTFF